MIIHYYKFRHQNDSTAKIQRPPPHSKQKRHNIHTPAQNFQNTHKTLPKITTNRNDENTTPHHETNISKSRNNETTKAETTKEPNPTTTKPPSRKTEMTKELNPEIPSTTVEINKVN